MLKKLKIATRVISLILSLILIYQASPIDAIAANIADLSASQSDDSIENEFNDVTNIYYGSHTLDVGRAGTLSVNDYSLIPYLYFNALSIDGNICPVNISMKYNSAEYRFLKEIADVELTSYGNGWCTDYNSFIIELEYENKVQLAYTTGNGAVILLEQTEPADEELATLPTGTTKWESASTYDCFIYKYTDEYAESISETGYQYIMHTENEIYSFDSDGRLTNIANAGNNTDIQIIYSESTFDAIEKIIDGVGREYRFTYTNGLLTKIKCYSAEGTEIIAGDNTFSAPLEISFAYTGEDLTQVTFPDGKNTTYTYNSTGNLVSANNIDNYKAELTYTNGTISKIAEYAMKNDEYVAGKYINISSDDNVRTFTDNTGDIQVKTFDDDGNIVSIVDGDGNYLYGEPEKEEEESSETIPEEESSETISEEESSEIQIEDTSEEYYEPVCPCADCPEWDCECVCESEDVCDCIQCKRYSDTANDAYGNIISESSFDGTKTMSSLTSYTSNGNYIASSVDTSGNQVYYIYGEDGFLDSMTSGNSIVNFAYDSMGNLIELSQQNSIEGYSFTMSNQYTYTNGRVTSITHNGFSYNFTYDEWGNQTTVSVGEHQLVGYEYDYANDSRLTKINYANGQSETYTYNSDGNVIAISHDNGATNTYEYEYDSDGVLTEVTDNRCGLVTTYTETSTEIRTADNTLVYSSATNEDGTQTENVLGNSLIYTYNSEYNQVTGKTVSTKAFSHSSVVTEDEIEYSISSDVDISVTTDWFGRTESKEISVDSVKTNTSTEETSELNVTGEYNYTYADTDTTASTRITSHSSSFVSDEFTNNRTDHYEYDESGNITGIYRYVDDVKTYYFTYVYDAAGQLIRENLLESSKTILYTYDVGGNIVSKAEYPYTLGVITADTVPDTSTSYTYEQNGWNDKVTNFTYKEGTKQRINTALTYDASGNVTSFNGGTYNWTAGRQLETYSASDGKQYNYYYNSDGFLAHIDAYNKSDVLTDSFDYIWDGDRLAARKYYSFSDDEGLISQVLYDSQDEAIGFITYVLEADTVTYEDIYLYRKNLQGDITGVLTYTGKLIAEYSYDAYGNVFIDTSKDIGLAISSIIMMLSNPLMYRGYVYTFLGDEIYYYLGSRYYIPQLGRFLNADKHTDTGTGVIGTNMYAYCNNNPVMFVDPTGESIITTLASILGIGAIPVATIAYIKFYQSMLCVRLFQWSFNNRYKDSYYDFASNRIGTKNWSSFIANKLKKSQVIQKMVKNIIKKMGTNKYYDEICYGTDSPAKISFYNTQNFTTWTTTEDKDLAWSIGSLSTDAYFLIRVKKITKNRYKVNCTLNNEYWDFDNSPSYSGFTKFIVGIGVTLEDTLKKTKPFYWGFSVAFYMNVYSS